MSYLVAGLAATALAVIELLTRLQTSPTLKQRAWLWWGLRLALEFGIGVAAISIAYGADAPGLNHWWGWIVAGASGSTVARFRVVTFGRDGDEKPVGLALIYEPIRDYFENQIDDVGATVQVAWIRDNVLPALNTADSKPKQVADRFSDYVRSLGRLSAVEKAEQIAYFSEIAESGQSEADRLDLLIRRTLELRGHRAVKDLYESVKPG